MVKFYKRIQCTSYLGIELMYTMLFILVPASSYISKLGRKLAQKMAILHVLRSIKYKVTQSSLFTLYHTIMQTHKEYCLTYWGPSFGPFHSMASPFRDTMLSKLGKSKMHRMPSH